VDIQGTSYTADLPINRHTERNRGRCMAARRDGEPANHPSFRNAAIEAQGSAVDALNMAAQGDERHHGTPLAVMPGATTRPRFQLSAITFLNLYIEKPVAVGQAKVLRRALV
jgi:hypothetical protein